MPDQQYVVVPYYPEWARDTMHYMVQRIRYGQALYLAGSFISASAAWDWLDDHRFNAGEIDVAQAG